MPGKRPRLTPSPGMVLKDGKLVMPFGTPGQRHAAAGDGPVAHQHHRLRHEPAAGDGCAALCHVQFPALVGPAPVHARGLAHLENRVDESVPASLLERGHDLRMWPAWTKTAGSLGAIMMDHENGFLHGAADPRRMAYAIGR